MVQADEGIVVGVLGQWASGKTEAARTLIGHLGGEGKVTFLTDRVLFARQVVDHILGLEDSQVVVSVEADGRRRLDGELGVVWLGPGEDLRTVDLNTLSFDVYDEQVMNAMRKRAKVEVGKRIREGLAAGKPIVIETAFGPNLEVGDENTYGRTIPDLFARLERSGVEPRQVKWIIVQAGYDTRLKRNRKRPDSIPDQYFELYAADGGDLAPDHQRRLEAQGTMIRRVANDHDDVQRFRSDIIAAFEELFSR
ncbi:MAG: hypothetical protein PVI80_11325 [Anaerolineae bacterium]|jgi:hypothetical protein